MSGWFGKRGAAAEQTGMSQEAFATLMQRFVDAVVAADGQDDGVDGVTVKGLCK